MLPHFHAKYREYGITVHIATGVVEGRFPKRALRHAMEWYELHRDDLSDNREKYRRKETQNLTDPLG